MVKVFAHDPAAHDELADAARASRRSTTSSCATSPASGYAVPPDLVERDWSQPPPPQRRAGRPLRHGLRRAARALGASTRPARSWSTSRTTSRSGGSGTSRSCSARSATRPAPAARPASSSCGGRSTSRSSPSSTRCGPASASERCRWRALAWPVLIADLVTTSTAVAATRSRKAKVAALADDRSPRPSPTSCRSSRPTSAGRCCSGAPAWAGAGCRRCPSPPASPSLTVREVHEAFDAARRPWRAPARSRRGRPPWPRCSAGPPSPSSAWLRGLVTGEVRQGALDALVQEALAAAAGVPLPGRTPRRDAGRLDGRDRAGRVRGRGRRWPRSGWRSAGRCCRCWPSSATDVAAAFAKVGARRRRGRRRHQARRDPDPGPPLRRRRRHRDPQPRRHHPPAARGGRAGAVAAGGPVRARRRGARARRRRPAAAVPGDRVAHRAWTSGVAVTAVLLRPAPPRRPRPARRARRRSGSPRSTGLVPEESLVAAAGHRPTRPRPRRSPTRVARRRPRGRRREEPRRAYDAGRRGAGWVKVKPVHTLDLVVLAVEWGSGRRKGWLSNIHLGARDPDRAAS